MPQPIPPLLAPYLKLPSGGSLTLVTSVLNARSNWLVLRFLCNALNPFQNRNNRTRLNENGGNGEKAVAVVLMSFMRDFEFWKREGRRLGLDLVRLGQDKKFTFIDGLTLFMPTSYSKVGGPRTSEKLPINSPKELCKKILDAMNELKVAGQQDVLLVLDQLDLFHAAAGDNANLPSMQNMILSLQQHLDGILLVLSADAPLIQTSSISTPLEVDHAGFVVSMAHQARSILQIRTLDTGVAKDVNGVLKLHQIYESEIGSNIQGEEGEEGEVLYSLQADGNVKVFERGY
ncbi:MAG: hypothetical protein M1834_003394 [Cirrosporium novae-zelandiae]|nr:MAG: hypothetical protein M1834_003394 [Cirrosporium novae-zelandiae]